MGEASELSRGALMEPGPVGNTELIASFLATHEAACPSCGYSLRGSPSDKCPECGCPVELFIRNAGPAALREHRHWLFMLIVCSWMSVGTGVGAAATGRWLLKFAPWFNSNSPYAFTGAPPGMLTEVVVNFFIDVAFAVVASGALWVVVRNRRRVVAPARAGRIFRFTAWLAGVYAVVWLGRVVWSWLFSQWW